MFFCRSCKLKNVYVAGLESKEPTVGVDVITNVAIKDATVWDQLDSAYRYGAPLTPRHRAISRLSRGTVLYSNTFLVIFIQSATSKILLRSEYVVSSEHGTTR